MRRRLGGRPAARKHDGHCLLVIIAGGELKLISRNGYDRTELFRLPFDMLRAALLPALGKVEGEIGELVVSVLETTVRRAGPYG